MADYQIYEYDCIIPLGGNCSVAMQLKRRSLRPYSLPFDWLAAVEPEMLEQSLDALETHFEKWLLRENLTIDPSIKNDYRVYVKDAGAHRNFIHDFYTNPITDEELDEVRAKYHRRIERLYAECKAAKRILFCVCGMTEAQLTKARLSAARERLMKLFPTAKVDIFGIVFSMPSTALEQEEGIVFSSVSRPYCEYDLYQSPAEWAWLDQVRFVGTITTRPNVTVKRKLSWNEKVHYKLYKHLEKWLERRKLLSLHFDE